MRRGIQFQPRSRRLGRWLQIAGRQKPSLRQTGEAQRDLSERSWLGFDAARESSWRPCAESLFPSRSFLAIEKAKHLMLSSELPKMDELAKLNVRRLSAGTAIAQITYKHVARLAENFLKEGDCGVFNEDAMQYSQLQNLFEGRE